jgi:hypothetical protein
MNASCTPAWVWEENLTDAAGGHAKPKQSGLERGSICVLEGAACQKHDPREDKKNHQ